MNPSMKFIFVGGLFLLWGGLSHSTECRISPLRLIDFSDRVVRKVHEANSKRPEDQQLSVPDVISIQTPISGETQGEIQGEPQEAIQRKGQSEAQGEVQGEVQGKTKKRWGIDFVYESLLRPRSTAAFTLMSLFLFKLERSRHLMYICLTLDSHAKQNSQLTIYFLKAFGLEPISWNRDNWATIPGDWWQGPDGWTSSKDRPVTALAKIPIELLPIHNMNNGVNKWLVDIPFIGQFFKIPGAALGFTNTFWEELDSILGAGVQRVRVNAKEIEFASEVDLEEPEKATILYRFSLQDQESAVLLQKDEGIK